jgi:hypothetical protein
VRVSNRSARRPISPLDEHLPRPLEAATAQKLCQRPSGGLAIIAGNRSEGSQDSLRVLDGEARKLSDAPGCANDGPHGHTSQEPGAVAGLPRTEGAPPRIASSTG